MAEEIPFIVDDLDEDPIKQQQDVVRSSFYESAEAVFDISKESTPVSSIKRLNEIHDAEEQDEATGLSAVPAAKLNEQYPDLMTPFREDTTPHVANIIAERQRHRMSLQQKASEGPRGGIYDAGRLGAGLIPHMIDPVNIAAGVAINLATPVLAVRALGATRAASLGLKAGKLTAGQGFVRNTAEGLVGNVLVEPLNIAADIQEGTAVDPNEVFVNVAAGAVGFSSAIYGGRKIFGAIKHLSTPRIVDELRRTGDANINNIQKSATAQLINGQKLDVDPIIKQIHEETFGNLKGRDYKYIKLERDFQGARPFYAATKRATKNFDSSPNTVIGEYYGRGVYLTDNPSVANASAARNVNTSGGAVFEIDLASKRLLDLDDNMPSELMADIGSFIKENNLDDVDFNKAGKDVLNDIQDSLSIHEKDPDLIDNLNQKIRSKGFDGYLEDGSKSLGMDHPQHNKVILFDEAGVKTKGKIDTELDGVKQPTTEEVQNTFNKQHSDENKFEYDVEAKSLIEERKQNPVSESTIDDIKKANDELDIELDEMEKLELLTDAEVSAIKVLKDAKKETELIDKILKAAQVCVGN